MGRYPGVLERITEPGDDRYLYSFLDLMDDQFADGDKVRLLNIRTLALLWVLMLVNSQAFATETMTLAQCLETGLKNNPAFKASRFNAKAAGEDIKTARADFLPSLSSGYSINNISSIASRGPADSDYLDQDIGSFNIRLSQILFAGSRIVNTYQKAKFSEEMAQAQADLKALELVYHIETGFYGLMKARQDVMIATEAVNRLTESVKSAEAFFAKELVPEVDLLQTRVDLADAKVQLGIAKNNVHRERIALLSLMDLQAEADVEFAEESQNEVLPPLSFDEAYKAAVKNRPDIRVLNFQLEIAKKEAAIALGKYLPVVRADISYQDQDRDYDAPGSSSFGNSYDRDQRNRYWSAGVYATWDIFDGGRSWYEKRKHNTDEQKILALVEDAENTISTGIKKALYSLSEARERMAGSAKAVSAAKAYYAGEEHRLKAGISTIPALLDAQVRLVRAMGNQTRAVLDYQTAASELKLMTGGKP